MSGKQVSVGSATSPVRHQGKLPAYSPPPRAQDHATTIGLDFQLAQVLYKTHFFGRKGYRQMLIDSINMHDDLHLRSRRVLGESHPLTRKIDASYLKCFDEQLDWSLDDLPRGAVAYRKWLQRGEAFY